MIESQSKAIKLWADQDRPREKMISKGKEALSDAELLAILIGSGTRNESAVDLSKRILLDVGNSLRELGKMSVDDMMQFRGIGEAKTLTISSALELGRRRNKSDYLEKVKVSSSRDAYQVLEPQLSDLSHEEFWIILLNRANSIIDSHQISRGGITGTVVDSRIVFEIALRKKACAIILAKNHPSGNLNPSESDRLLTNKMSEAGKVLDITVLDHIIISDQGYYSFADESLL
jgi:DNA repair protein RadC